jgi:IS5 family transposase
MSLSEGGFERRRTREFPDEKNLVVAWAELVTLIAPHAPTRDTKGGRPPFPVETMLRIHFLHLWTRRFLQAIFGEARRSAHIYSAC